MKILRIAIAAGAVAAGSMLLLPGTASAHHPVLSKTEARPCGVDQPWSGTFTAESDQDWNKNWRNTYSVGGGAPVGWSPWVDDQVPFGPIAVGPFAADVASVTITVSSEWQYPNGGGTAKATRSIDLVRPGATDCAAEPVAPTLTAPTCSAPGTVVGVETEAYSWEYTGPDTARLATAVAKPGHTLTGQTVFGQYDLEQLPADSDECEPPETTTTVEETTTTVEETTTTVEETTTTVEETTTTVEETTTTAEVSSNAPTTTAGVASNAPTTTLGAQLPSTGSSSTTAVLGLALLAGGLALAFTARRRQTI
jgi:LPXTG-motif cell wall-anchored protein